MNCVKHPSGCPDAEEEVVKPCPKCACLGTGSRRMNEILMAQPPETELGQVRAQLAAANALLEAMRAIPRWEPCPAEPEEDDDGPLFQGFLTDATGTWVRWEDVDARLSGQPAAQDPRDAEMARLTRELSECRYNSATRLAYSEQYRAEVARLTRDLKQALDEADMLRRHGLERAKAAEQKLAQAERAYQEHAAESQRRGYALGRAEARVRELEAELALEKALREDDGRG